MNTKHFDFLLTGELSFPTIPEIVTAPSGQASSLKLDDKIIRLGVSLSSKEVTSNLEIGRHYDIVIDEVKFSTSVEPQNQEYRIRGTLSLTLPDANNTDITVSSSGIQVGTNLVGLNTEIHCDNGELQSLPEDAYERKAELSFYVWRPEEPSGLFITSYACATPDLYLGEPGVHASYVEAAFEAYTRLTQNVSIDLPISEAEKDEAQKYSDEDFFHQLNEAKGRPFSVQFSRDADDIDRPYEWAVDVQFFGPIR